MRAFQPWLMPDILFSVSKYGALQKQALSVLHTHTRETIQHRRQEMKAKKISQENKDTNDEFSKWP